MKRVIVTALDSRVGILRQKVGAAAERLARREKGTSFEVYLGSDRFMKKNVLAFPAPEGFPHPDIAGGKFLGEIYLNPFYIKRKGEDLLFMLIHGYLHLLGYDHIKKGDRMAMERRERSLLALLRGKR